MANGYGRQLYQGQPLVNNPVGTAGYKPQVDPSFWTKLASFAGSPLGITSILSLASEVASQIGGSGARKEAKADLKKDRGRLESSIGRPIFNPLTAATYSYQGMQPQLRAGTEQIDERLGLNTGQGWGAAKELAFAPLMAQLGQGYRQNKTMMADRDFNAMRLLFGESANRYMGA